MRKLLSISATLLVAFKFLTSCIQAASDPTVVLVHDTVFIKMPSDTVCVFDTVFVEKDGRVDTIVVTDTIFKFHVDTIIRIDTVLVDNVPFPGDEDPITPDPPAEDDKPIVPNPEEKPDSTPAPYYIYPHANFVTPQGFVKVKVSLIRTQDEAFYADRVKPDLFLMVGADEFAENAKLPEELGISYSVAADVTAVEFDMCVSLPDPIEGKEYWFWIIAADNKDEVFIDPFLITIPSLGYNIPSYEAPEPIDLGDSFSVLWASKNLGAKDELSAGDYFAYAEYWTKTSYRPDNYSLNNVSDCIPNSISGDPKFDVGVVTCPDGWRLPTEEEVRELTQLTNVSFKSSTNSFEFKSKENGEKMYMPLSGYFSIDGVQETIGTVDIGAYMISERGKFFRIGNNTMYGIFMEYAVDGRGEPYRGYTVRLVKDKKK